ncbi:MAG: tetratricopeptide repeat protein [Bacteroidetes bacterium]|nr:tetratricopeptide repeat protein [Bacteroidota bacterium]
MNYKTKVFILIFTVFLFKTAKSQTFENLYSNWKNSKNDSLKVNSGLQLVKKFYLNKEDSVFKTINLLQEIFKLSQKNNFNKSYIVSSFYLGNCYTLQSKPNVAIEYYYISIKKAEKIGDDLGISKAKMGIGLVYFSQNNWKNAIEYFKGSLQLSKKLNNQSRISTQQYLIGISYNYLKQYKLAISYLDSSYILKKKIGDLTGINECLLGIADYNKNTGNTDTAIKIYNTLEGIYLQQKEYVPVSLINSSLAEIYLNENKIQLALEFAQKAVEYAEKSTNLNPKLKAFDIIYKIYNQMKDFKNSMNFYIKYQNTKDSIENKDFISQISIANAEYKFEKEQNQLKLEQHKQKLEHEIEIKNKNRNQSLLFAMLLIMFLVGVIIVFSYRGLKKQKKISENLLLNILPLETVNELKKHGKSLSKIHKGVTIMFCDVKNFSSIAEQLSAEEVVEILHIYFKEFDRIMHKYGIEKIKTIGDAYMCVSGLNSQPHISAINCVKSAIDIFKFTKSIEKTMIGKYNQAFSFRIGIHTGNVVSGVVGEKKYSYDVWGDAVNVAARMEQNSEPGFINISESTFALIKEDFNCTCRGVVPIKNKAPVSMYFVDYF